ncbi:Golgi membrane protein 1-like isoform X2 [Littorina saxatilis]|uniref:Golgi membrane protein 1-like isoform X2 n=1 Tax=Littorina saxatilis TaxID=31220 RepID=UPI0038B5C575
MSGNGRGNMRPTSRSPPFLVVGLLVAMCILAFNYWNVSSKNGELTRQMESLQVDFRAVSDKHLTVEKRAAELASQLSDLQTKGNQLQNGLSVKNDEVSKLSSDVENLKSQLQKSTESLQQAQSEAQQAQQEKSSVNAELEKVKAELMEQKNAPVVCDKNGCKDVIREIVGALTTHIGKPAVAGAFKDKQEVMQIVADLLEGADQQQQQQQQQQPQAPAEGQQNPDPNKAGEQPAANQPAAPGGQPQAQVVGQDPNVVQMMQQRQRQQLLAAEGLSYQQQAVGGGVGGGDNNVLLEGQQQPPRDNLVDLQKQMDALVNPGNNHAGLGPDGKLPEIVPQNIPNPGSDEGALNPLNPNPLNPIDPNAPVGQEDVADNHHLDLPEDEMDKQAAANHGAEDMVNLGNDLHDQLQDLSKNEQAVDENKGKLVEDDAAKDMDEDPDAHDKLQQARDEEDEFEYDEHDQRRMEETNLREDQATSSDIQNVNGEAMQQGVAHMAVQGQDQRNLESGAVATPTTSTTTKQQQENEQTQTGEKNQVQDNSITDSKSPGAQNVIDEVKKMEDSKTATTTTTTSVVGLVARPTAVKYDEDEEKTPGMEDPARKDTAENSVDKDTMPLNRDQEGKAGVQ